MLARNRIISLSIVIVAQLWTTLLAHADSGFSIEKPNELQQLINSATGETGGKVKLIFIPGILGSKLLRQGTVLANNDFVWGGVKTDDPALIYDGEHKLQSAFFDKVDIPLLDHMFDTDVYGQALLMLQDSNDLNESDVLKFSYDWRQSNVLSAKDFNNWLCANKTKLKGDKVVILAHSMGGLVLKNWFIDFYDKGSVCQANENDWLHIEQVVFAGTPHFGAPKALAALFGQYSLFDNWFARHVLGDGVKKFGYSFDSFYELLPVQNDPDCDIVANGAELPNAIVEGAAANAFPDIFNIAFMKKYDLPRVDNIDRAKFREQRLSSRLPEIAKRACELAEYQFPKLGLSRVLSVSGINPAGTTTSNTTLQMKETVNGWEATVGIGDGTVPRASSMWEGVLTDQFHATFVNSLHMKIPADPIFKVALQTEIHDIPRQKLQLLKSQSPAAYQQVVKSLASQKRLLYPSPIDAGHSKESQMVNADIFTAGSLSVIEVQQAARLARAANGQSDVSYVLNDYIANSDSTNDVDKLFAKNAVAAELLNMGYASIAKPKLDELIPMNLKLIEDPPLNYSSGLVLDIKKAAGNELNNRGIILNNQGDTLGAFKDLTDSAKLGNLKAKLNLHQLELQ